MSEYASPWWWVGSGLSAVLSGAFGYSARQNKQIHRSLQALPVDSVEAMHARLSQSANGATYGVVRVKTEGTKFKSPYSPQMDDCVAIEEEQLEIRTTQTDRVRERYNSRGRKMGSEIDRIPWTHIEVLDHKTYADVIYGRSLARSSSDGTALLVLTQSQFYRLYSPWRRIHVQSLRKDDYKWQEEERDRLAKRVTGWFRGGERAAPVQVTNQITQHQGGSGEVGSCRYAIEQRAIRHGQCFTALGVFRKQMSEDGGTSSNTLNVADPDDTRRPFVISYREPHDIFDDWRKTAQGQTTAAAVFGVMAVGLAGGGYYFNRR